MHEEGRDTLRTTVYTGYDWDDFGAQLMVENILTECGIESYTLYKASGHWKGKSENAIIIEVMGDDDTQIHEAAHVLRYNMDRPQEAVYVVREIIDLLVI